MFEKLNFSEFINEKENELIIKLEEKINPLDFFIKIDISNNYLNNVYRIDITYHVDDSDCNKKLFITNYKIPITQKRYLYLHCTELKEKFSRLNLICESMSIKIEPEHSILKHFEISKFFDDIQRESIVLDKDNQNNDYNLLEGYISGIYQKPTI